MEGESTTSHESKQETQPARIYVASLADYNAGRLHGTWIDAVQHAEDINTSIEEMLDRSRQPIAEEWAIHDYEGFQGVRIGEYESIDTVSRLAEGIARHGEPFGHWAQYIGTQPEDLDEFEDHYRGTWPTAEEFAADLVDDLYGDWENSLPQWLARYVALDVEALARDLAIEMHIAEGSEGVYVFEP